MKTARKRITEGRLATTLIRMALPMMVGILGVAVFNLVDTYFVGQLGATELAAMSFTFPVVFFTGSVAMGVGVGTNAILAKLVGAEEDEKVKRITTDALLLAAALVFVLVGCLYLFFDPLFILLGATDQLMPLIRDYMYIWMLGAGFIVVPMIGNNAIRATGDTLTPSIVMLISMGLNIILDPILIFGLWGAPALGLQGAALATVIARGFTLLAALWIVFRRKHIGAWEWPTWLVWTASVRQILKIGLPAIGSQIIIPIGQGILIGIASRFGEIAVAAFGVGLRVELFAFTVIFAFGAALAPIAGQNWGAKNYQRVRDSAQHALRFTALWGVLFLVLITPNAYNIARMFGNDPELIQKIALFFQILPWGYLFFGGVVIGGTMLNVLHRPKQSVLLTITHMFLLMSPLAYLGSLWWGYTGILFGMVIGMALAGMLGYSLLKVYTTDERMAH